MAKEEECEPCEAGAPLWMVTYGDMVTLLLCLFVMIYATGKAPPQEVRLILSAFSNSLGFFEGGQTLSKGRLEEMGMNLESLPSQTVGRSLSRSKREAKSVFKPEIKSKKVRITEDERGLIISLLGADYFQPGSALLTQSLRDVLLKAGGLIRNLDKFVRVEGHASSGEAGVQSGDGQSAQAERVYDNAWDLSSTRSVNVAYFLQSHGVNPSLMQTVGFGSYRPLALEGDQGTPEAAAHNRRIDIVILPYKDPTAAVRNPVMACPPRVPRVMNPASPTDFSGSAVFFYVFQALSQKKYTGIFRFYDIYCIVDSGEIYG